MYIPNFSIFSLPNLQKGIIIEYTSYVIVKIIVKIKFYIVHKA